MSKSEAAPEPKVKVLKKKFKFFDENFNEQSREETVNFVAETSYESAVAKLGNDTARILAAINRMLESEAIEAKRPAGLSKAVVLNFIKPFRESKPFSDMVTGQKGDKGWKEQYANQTKAILEQARASEFIMNAIRSANANAVADEDSSDDEN